MRSVFNSLGSRAGLEAVIEIAADVQVAGRSGILSHYPSV
jgi:hypothetical protein